MSSGFAAKLLPHFSFIVYVQFFLLALAALAGIVLIIRHILSKEPIEGDPAYTKERIAQELETEIARLKDLRRRILPGYEDDKAAAAPAVTVAAPAALSEEDKAKLQQEAEAKFKEQIQSLEAKVAELTESLKNASAAAPAPAGDGQVPTAVLAELNKEKAALEEEKKKLGSKVEALEKTLTEYQIFENDIALVKKYKTENEELRKQLSATPQVTEEDIASLFTAMAPPGGAAPAAAAAAAPAPAPSPAPVAAAPASAPTPAPAPAPEVPPEVVASNDAQIDALLGEAAAQAEASSDPLPSLDDLLKEAEKQGLADDKPEDFVAESVKSEPSVTDPAPAANLSEEDLEALAQTDQNSDDKLMAEFQKILGGDKT